MGATPVSEIDEALVLRVLTPIWTSLPATASKVRGRIESVLDWATAHDYRPKNTNPARWRGNLAYAMPKTEHIKPSKSRPSLPFAKMPSFMVELRARRAQSARALELTALTAARTTMTLGMRWGEVDLEEASWTIPAERMKGRRKAKREHRVPLPVQAVGLLRDLRPKDASPDDLVFCNRKTGKRLAPLVMIGLLERMKQGDVTPDGFAQHFGPGLSETALAHQIGDETERAYNHGDLFDRRRALMQMWADYCCGVQRDGAVVVLHPRAA